ncbi:FecR domain-containing protein [Stappia indica]|uniref:FecR domain-containing protein n=1 Tax=Stappia indica TaxID=538381 RepID=UPI00082C399C|nr:FecR domain-containing protein [Stappia indica]
MRRQYVVAALGAALVSVPGSAMARNDVGVAAAVNQDALRTPPGAGTRTVVLGDNLIYRERIETAGEGLVQILLVDGSTFTVGANSDLVIDEFVYDPNAGTGKLVATFGKGVARFVGGRLSKNAGGVTVKTPVGTIGIRGGIANLNLLGGGARFSLLFGDELSFTGLNGETRRIYERGYTLAIASAQAGNYRPEIRRTNQSDIAGVQQGLGGRPGQTGGISSPPTDTQVRTSGIGPANSGQPIVTVMPRPRPEVVQSTRITEGGQVVNEINHGATGDIIRDVVVTDPPPPVEGGEVEMRVLTAASSYAPAFETFTVTDPGRQGLIGGTPGSDTTATFTVTGGGTQLTGTIGGETITIPLPTGGEAAFRVVTSGGRTVAGTVHRNGNHFLAFTYFEEISAPLLIPSEGPGEIPVPLAVNRPVFGLWGVPTDPNAVRVTGANQIRRYHLSADPIQVARSGVAHDLYFLNPLAGEMLGSYFLQNVRTSDFLVVTGNNTLADEDPRFLVSSMLIQGQGAFQSSAISVSTGRIYEDEVDGLVIGGPRRGGFRASGYDPSVLYGGPVSSVGGGDGGHVFGPNGENFVLGFGVGDLDTGNDSSPRLPLPYGSITDTVSGYTHVGQLASTSPVGEFTRTTRLLNGFASGMVEVGTNNGVAVPFWSLTPEMLTIGFDAVNNSVGASMTVLDALEGDDHIAALVLGFGDSLFTTGPNGQSALIDDDRYALTYNFGETFAITEEGSVIAPDSNPRSYMVPSTLVAGADNALFTDVARCTCAFMEWGYWGTRFRGEDVSETAPFDPRRRDFVHLGTWAAGDVSTYGELPTVGTASYAGHAVGNVARATTDGPVQYLAAGNFNMTYDFGSRSGSASITNFDGYNFGGSVAAPTGSLEGLNLFAGGLGNPEETLSGVLTGSFVRGPAGPAQGVVGSFGVSDPSGSYTATGVVVGQQ